MIDNSHNVYRDLHGNIMKDLDGNPPLDDCPFCGANVVFSNEWHNIEFEVVGRYIQCPKCHIRTETLPITLNCPKEQVDLSLAEVWNRRVK